MHYNTCDHGTVKRDVQLARHLSSRNSVWASSIDIKAFVFIVILDRITTSIEEGRSFQLIGICSIIPSWLPVHGFGLLQSRCLSGLGPGRLANEAT